MLLYLLESHKRMNSQKETIKNWVPQFVESLREKRRSPATVLAYRADLEQLVAFLSEQKKETVDDVTQESIEAFRDYLINQKYTAKSVSRKLNAIKTFFRWLKENNALSTDPSREVSHPKIEASAPKFLTEAQYRYLRDIVRSDLRIAAIIELILQTGMRISEVANLKLEHVAHDEITIEAYATQPGRTVVLNSAARFLIEDYLRVRPNTNASIFLFVSKNGKQLAVRNIRAAIDRYMLKAEMPNYSVNDLRNTFIVENLKRGVDLVTISQAVGHRRISTTERYVELAGINEAGKKQKLETL